VSAKNIVYRLLTIVHRPITSSSKLSTTTSHQSLPPELSFLIALTRPRINESTFLVFLTKRIMSVLVEII